jgi:hypothetical protein
VAVEGASGVEELQVADQHFLHDLKIYWDRANVLLVVHGALLALYGGAFDDADVPRDVELAVGVAGVVTALLWFMIALGTERRIRIWRTAVTDAARRGRATIVLAAEEAPATRFQSPPVAAIVRFVWNPTQVSLLLPLVALVGWVLVLYRGH